MSGSLAPRGDYMGFTYNGVHSSDLGIVRTSDGSRFNENLLPTIQDKTVQIPGRDGAYFFGSYYTQRQFSVPFAFDSMSEKNVRDLKALLGDKQVHELIFDETPYKTYHAKVTGNAQIKHIVFDEGEGKERIYKGEGTIQFTCHQPYAICSKKWLSDYPDCENKGEWHAASGLLETQGNYDKLSSNEILLYNPGDIDSHFLMGFIFKNGKIPAGKIYIDNGQVTRQLQWDEIKADGKDTKVIFNSRLNLIEGYNGTAKSGYIYNKYISAGEFFTIPQGESKLVLSDENNVSSYMAQLDNTHIQYSYYYL